MPSVLELYEKLKPKLGEDEARSLLEYVETSIEQRAATKADLKEAVTGLREEIHQVQSSLREEIHQVQSSLREEIHRVQSSLRGEFHRVREDVQAMRAEIIKWSFAFWLGTIAVLSGIMFTLLRTVGPR